MSKKLKIDKKPSHGKADFYIHNNNMELKNKLKEIAKQKGVPYGTYLRSFIIQHVKENEVLLSAELKNN